MCGVAAVDVRTITGRNLLLLKTEQGLEPIRTKKQFGEDEGNAGQQARQGQAEDKQDGNFFFIILNPCSCKVPTPKNKSPQSSKSVVIGLCQ